MTLSQTTLESRKRITSLEEYQSLYDQSLTANEEFWRT